SGYLTKQNTQFDLAPFRVDKLIFQNIIAHVANPSPHIMLIGCHDREGSVTLDTVNNIVRRDNGLDLHAVLALLHSGPVNWFVYAVVYNKAIRTMHFDQYFLNKIPLPQDFEAIQGRLAALAKTSTELAALTARAAKEDSAVPSQLAELQRRRR